MKNIILKELSEERDKYMKEICGNVGDIYFIGEQKARIEVINSISLFISDLYE